MICKNCKHWKPDKEHDYRYAHLLYVLNPETYKKEIELARFCENPKVLFYETPPKDGVSVVDGSEYLAKMITGEEYGCVNFEKNNVIQHPLSNIETSDNGKRCVKFSVKEKL